jgi:hypothetical protein
LGGVRVHVGVDAYRMQWSGEFFYCGDADARHDSAINAGEFDGDSNFGYADQSFLDGVDGQRGCGRIQGGAMLGSRLREFCADCNTDWRGIQ